MTVPQGLARFPGITHLLSATISLGHGISPGSAQLRIAPQESFPHETGTLSISYGETSLEFPDCKLDRSNVRRGEDGERWTISLMDRRWKWRFGQVSGKYNVWREDATLQQGTASPGSGELVANTERSPQQLAALYLDALGETGYDVSELPDETRPPVDHDHDNPADALAELCESLGCRVVLRLNNTVRLVRSGVGAELPADFLLENAPAVNFPEKPDRIAVACGPSFFQTDFPLEAVGLDLAEGDDGSKSETLKPIDELSYKPTGGWSVADLPYFNNVAIDVGGRDIAALRAVAVKSVFRYYRVITPVHVPGYGQVDRLEQILPLFEEQVRTGLENAHSAPLPAAVFGQWFPGLDEQANTEDELTPQGDSPPSTVADGTSKSPFYLRGFSVDTARGVVIFDEPVYRNSTPQAAAVTVAPAKLVLRTKCQVRDAETLAVSRHVRERSSGSGLNTQPRYLKHDELVLTHVPTYDAATYGQFPTGGGTDPRAVTAIATNLEEVNAAADRYLDVALAEYTQSRPRRVRAIGIRAIELDGAIEQITYSVNASGAVTSVARNAEMANHALSHGERRASETARRAAEQARQSRSEAMARRIRRESAAGRRAR